MKWARDIGLSIRDPGMEGDDMAVTLRGIGRGLDFASGESGGGSGLGDAAVVVVAWNGFGEEEKVSLVSKIGEGEEGDFPKSGEETVPVQRQCAGTWHQPNWGGSRRLKHKGQSRWWCSPGDRMTDLFLLSVRALRDLYISWSGVMRRDGCG